MFGGIFGAKFKGDKCGAELNKAMIRMNIHRQKKLNSVAKTKDVICGHLNSGNEVNAKIYTETLINDEGRVPCYDIASTMCDQVKGRIEYIAKFGAPQDMTQTFATLIHIAPKMQVEELMEVRKQLTALLGKEFAAQSDLDKKLINPLVAENIDFKKPMDGEIIYRMKELAQERNIQYTPSQDMQFALNNYLELKCKVEPGVDGAAVQPLAVPQYQPPPQNFNNQQPPMPPPPGGGPGGNVPMYNPQAPQGPPMQPQMDYSLHDPNAPPAYNPMVPPQPPSYNPQQLQPPTYDPNAQPGYAPMPQAFPVYQPNTGGGDIAHGQPVMDPNIGGGNQINNSTGAGDVDDLEARLRALDGK